MRTTLAIALVLALAPLAPAAPQVAGPTERKPNKDTNNMYPRWLTYTEVGGEETSVTVDTRGVVHLLDASGYRILHRSSAVETRGVSGFTKDDKALVLDPGITQDIGNTVGSPDIWAHTDDTLHAVWWHRYPDTVNNPPKDKFEILYAKKDAAGWSAPVKFSQALPNQHYVDPQVAVDRNGWVHVVCARYDFSSTLPYPRYITARHFAFNPATPYAPGSNPRETEIPTANPEGSIRLALDAAGNPSIVWGAWTGSTNQIYYSRGTFAAGSVSFPGGTIVGAAPTNKGPDIAVDAGGQPHIVFVGSPQGAFDQDTVYYRGPAGLTAVSQSLGSYYTARVLVDSRGQPHVMWGGNGLNYAAQVKNPNPSTVDTATWYRQERVAHPGPDVPSRAPFGRLSEVALSRNDEIHVVDRTQKSRYTRTIEYGLGARDSAAMASALPGGAVNVANGNLVFNVALFNTNGTSPTQSAIIHYNSLDFSSGLVAPGWRLNFESYLIDHKSDANGDPKQLTVIYGDGRPVHFRWNDTWSYFVPEDEFGVFDKAEKVDPEYRVTTKFGTTMTFNEDGKLREIKEVSGNFTRLTWGAAGRLDDITDQLPGTGRKTTLTYETAGSQLYPPRLKRITDPGGKIYDLVYTQNQLTEVKFTSASSATSWKAEYPTANDATLQERVNLPKRILPPRGVAGGYGWKIGYLQDNRAAKFTDPESAEMTLTFKEDVATSALRETRVKNRRSFETLYKVEPRRALVKEIEDAVKLGGNASIKPVVRQFDQYGNLVSVQDRYGFTTSYDFYTSQSSPQSPHVRNNLREIRKPGASGTPEPVVTYEYTADELSLVAETTTYCTPIKGQAKRSRVTRYTYVAGGILQRVDYPDVNEPAGVNQTGVFVQYDRNGPRRALSRIQNEMGNSTIFSNFDGNGLPMTITRTGGGQAVTRQYNAMGLMTQEQLPTGGAGNDAPALQITTYDGLWRVADKTDGRGTKTTYGYDADSHVTSIQTGPLTATSTTYDRRGFPSGGSGPDGSWSQTADAHGNVLTHTNMRGGVTTSTFDPLDRIKTSSDPAVSSTFTYDDFSTGSPSSTVTVAGRTTRTEVDGRGRAIKVTEPLGRVTQTYYDEQDQVLATQVIMGGVFQTCTVLRRDDRDRVYLTRVQNSTYEGTAVGTPVDRYTVYNKAGSVIREVDPLGTVSNTSDTAPHAIKYRRDARERVSEIVDGFGVVAKKCLYGDDDMPTEVQWPDPGTKSATLATQVRLTWTGNKEQKSAVNRNGKGVNYTYKALPGQVATVTDPLTRQTVLDYHPGSERLKSITEASGTADARVTSHTWEKGQHKTTTVWNPQAAAYSSVYTNTYDPAFRQTGFIPPAPGTGTAMAAESTTYTTASEPDVTTIGTKKIDRNYNLLGQYDKTTYTGLFGTVVQDKIWNGIDLLKEVKEGTNSHKMDYDVFRGAPTVETIAPGGWSKIQTHSVDPAGNFVDFVDAEGKSHGTPVDANNRPLRVAYQGAGVCELKYTPGGLLDTTTLKTSTGGTAAVSESVYDGLGRQVQSKTVQGGTLKVLSDLRWTYNDANLVTSYSMAHLGVTFTYAYNARNELTGESTTGNAGGSPPGYVNQLGGPPTGLESLPSVSANAQPGGIIAVPAWNAVYVLDPAGNRKSQTVNGVTTTFTLNGLSQVTNQSSTDGRTVAHVYDELGNEVKRTTVLAGVTTEETFGYNHVNLWSTYVKKVGAVVQVNQVRTYTPGGQLVEDWDQRPGVTPVARVTVPRFGEVKTEYTRQSAGAPALANSYLGLGLDGKCTQITAGGVRTHTVGDLVGTIGMTLSDAGVPQVTSVKSAFGLKIASQGTLPPSMAGIAGSWLAFNTGYSFLRNRFYDPSLGRFTQTDPVLGNRPSHHYNYALHNPISRKDPLGLCSICGQRDCYGCGTTTGAILNWITDFGVGVGNGISSGDSAKIAWGSVKGSTKYLGGMLKTGLIDVPGAYVFQSEESLKLVEKARNDFALAWHDQGLYGVLVKPIADDFSGSLEAYAQGNPDKAGQKFGSGGLQVYMAGKSGYQLARGGVRFTMVARSNGMGSAFRAVGRGIADWFKPDFSLKGNLGWGPARPFDPRSAYVGENPNWGGPTNRNILMRMLFEEKSIRLNADLEPEVMSVDPNTGQVTWTRLSSATCDQAHVPVDAVRYWNSTGRWLGARAPEIRNWMLNPENYTIQPRGMNRSAGGSLPDEYKPPIGGTINPFQGAGAPSQERR
jgi:RHS repeat-associated protein